MMVLAEMTAAHVPQIVALENICFSDPWSGHSIAVELKNPLSLWLVALDGEDVAGYIGSQSVMDEADMMNLAVAPRYRRQGVGERLVLALVDRLRSRGVCRLSLEVRDSNLPALALYTKLGFRQVGLRPNYYLEPREDARILRKEWTL